MIRASTLLSFILTLLLHSNTNAFLKVTKDLILALSYHSTPLFLCHLYSIPHVFIKPLAPHWALHPVLERHSAAVLQKLTEPWGSALLCLMPGCCTIFFPFYTLQWILFLSLYCYPLLIIFFILSWEWKHSPEFLPWPFALCPLFQHWPSTIPSIALALHSCQSALSY